MVSNLCNVSEDQDIIAAEYHLPLEFIGSAFPEALVHVNLGNVFPADILHSALLPLSYMDDRIENAEFLDSPQVILIRDFELSRPELDPSDREA